MIYNVDDISVINNAYADGYTDCERDHRDEWEWAAWRKGFGVGVIVEGFIIFIILLAFQLMIGG